MTSVQVRSLCLFGSICAGVAGAAFVVMVVCALFAPTSIVTYVASEQYFEDFVAYKNKFILLKWMMVIANLALIGVVCAFFSLRRGENEGIVTWASVIALIGFGAGIWQAVEDLTMVPYLAREYAISSEMIRSVIIHLGVANPSMYLVSMGLPGIWFIVVSGKAWNNPMIPKHLVIFGLLWGIGNFFTIIAHVFIIIKLIYLVAIGALICAPIWSISESIYLYKLSKKKIKD